MERMEEAVPDAAYEPMQDLLSDAQWDEWAVMDEVARRSDQAIGDSQEACLVIDESAFGKQGRESAGVARQYDGRRGKVDNCQVGVFAYLANGQHVTPLYARLFLPKTWTEDPARMKKVKVPQEFRRQKSKPEIAKDLIARCRSQKLRYGWITGDGLYGNCPDLLWSIVESQEIFMMDVHKDQHVYLDDPRPSLPEARSHRGRRPLWRSAETSLRVDALFAAKSEDAWQHVQVRDTTRGVMVLKACSQVIWQFNPKNGQTERWHAVAVCNLDGSEMSYGMSNAPCDTPLSRLIFMKRQRFWIERGLQNAKSSLGMAQYQARGWHSWHRHMTFVFMALLFMLQMRILKKEQLELLSCEDIKEVLANVLPDRRVTPDEVYRQLTVRHEKRRRAIAQAYERQRIISERREES